MHIRTMTIADYDQVCALWLVTPHMGLNTLDDSREGIARYLARNPDTCFVAELDGTVIGAVLGGHDGRRGFLYHVAVAQSAWRQGVGTALVEAAVAALAREGIRKVALVVKAGNVGGGLFWDALGFAERSDLAYRDRVLTALPIIVT